MKIYLLDQNKEITDEWNEYFSAEPDVEIVNCDFRTFMDAHPDVDCIVSPANSFGIMNGGYDYAIIEYFGIEVQNRVQDYIRNNLCGEQPVGTSFSVRINESKLLIHTPTMRLPSAIKDADVVYHCTRSTLTEAFHNKVQTIVIPAFGGCCGKLSPYLIAGRMYVAYRQIKKYLVTKEDK